MEIVSVDSIKSKLKIMIDTRQGANYVWVNQKLEMENHEGSRIDFIQLDEYA